jgi:hypothetical protein
MLLPPPYLARPYRGCADHPAMTEILAAYREHSGNPELPTVDQLDVSYGNLKDCDPGTDIAIIEHGAEVVAYARAYWEDLESGVRDCVVLAPIRPDHLDRPLFTTVVAAEETHMQPWARDAAPARFRAYAAHPGPGQAPVGEAEWLEELG